MTFFKYCCGFKLSTSCVIIGCILLIYDAAIVIRLIIAGANWEPDMIPLVGKEMASTVAVILPVCCCIDALTSILLILGAIKRRPVYLIPWMFTCVITILVFIVGFISGWIFLKVYMIIIPVVFVSLLVYFGIVVHSLYEEFTVAPIIVT